MYFRFDSLSVDFWSTHNINKGNKITKPSIAVFYGGVNKSMATMTFESISRQNRRRRRRQISYQTNSVIWKIFLNSKWYEYFLHIRFLLLLLLFLCVLPAHRHNLTKQTWSMTLEPKMWSTNPLLSSHYKKYVSYKLCKRSLKRCTQKRICQFSIVILPLLSQCSLPITKFTKKKKSIQ